MEHTIPPELLSHILSFVPCEQNQHWDHIRQVNRRWKCFAESKQCSNPNCTPEKLMLSVLLDNNVTLLRHWWNKCKDNPEWVMSDFVIEVCTSVSIEFTRAVLDQCDRVFSYEADTKHKVATFLRNLLVRACDMGRADILTLLVDNNSVRLTRSVLKCAAKRLHHKDDPACLYALLPLQGTQKTLVSKWWVDFLVNEELSRCMLYLLSNPLCLFGQQSYNLTTCLHYSVNQRCKMLAEQVVASVYFQSEHFFPYQFIAFAKFGWTQCIGSVLNNPMIQLDQSTIQLAFEEACTYGQTSVVEYFLTHLPQQINVNSMEHNQLFFFALRAGKEMTNVFVSLAWNQLHFEQTPDHIDTDPCVMAAKLTAFQLLSLLNDRQDVSIWMHIDRVLEHLIEHAKSNNNEMVRKQAQHVLRALLTEMDRLQIQEQEELPTKRTAYRLIRFARKCSDDCLMSSVRNNDTLLRLVK